LRTAGPTGRLRRGPRALGWALLETVVLYGLLGWVYVAAVAALRPNELPLPLTEWWRVRRDTFGICCFSCSACAFFLRCLGPPFAPLATGEQQPTEWDR
jgi:hypothetical protein